MKTSFTFAVAEYCYDPATGWHQKQPSALGNDHDRLLPELHLESTVDLKYTARGIYQLVTGRTTNGVRSFFSGWMPLAPGIWIGDDYSRLEGRTLGQCVFIADGGFSCCHSTFKMFYFPDLVISKSNRGRFLAFAKTLAAKR